MKKSILILGVFLLNGCASPDRKHTIYQDQISDRQQQIHEDARAFLAKAEQLLRDNKTTDPNIKKALEIIDKSQVLFGSTAADEDKLSQVKPEDLDKTVNSIFEEDKKTLTSIDDLKDKDKIAIEETLALEQQQHAILEDQKKNRHKWYAICISILSILAAIAYYIPTNIIKSFIGSLFNRSA